MQRRVRVAWCTAASSFPRAQVRAQAAEGSRCTVPVKLAQEAAGLKKREGKRCRRTVGLAAASRVGWGCVGSPEAERSSRRARSALPAGRARRERGRERGGSRRVPGARGWLGFGGVPFGSRDTFSPGGWRRYWQVAASGLRASTTLACQRRDSAQASCSITSLCVSDATPRHLNLPARVASRAAVNMAAVSSRSPRRDAGVTVSEPRDAINVGPTRHARDKQRSRHLRRRTAPQLHARRSEAHTTHAELANTASERNNRTREETSGGFGGSTDAPRSRR
jgi:hypothetical protein